MAGKFMCGAKEIPVGVSEFSVSATMPFDPKAVSLSVRQPVADAPLISAYLVGKATYGGFSVAFSAPVPMEGYVLEWMAFAEGSGSIDDEEGAKGDSSQLGYTDLFRSVARFLGYDADDLTAQQREEVDMCVQSGVRNFYYPAALNGGDWSFLTLEGSLAVEEGNGEYLLPDGIGNISGQMYFDASEQRRGVVIVPFGDIQMMRRNPVSGAPRFAAVVSTNRIGGKGQMRRVHFYPTPDKAYMLTFRADADTGKLDAERRPYPLGGHAYSEIILESCLAVAEQRVNDEVGIHTQNFNQHLEAAINRDGRSGAQNFGQMGDSHDW